MSFYVRKSLSVGPFRFNLSKSGVGLSVGVQGIRIGTGPKGNYVHMGLGGVYYKATLPPSSTRSTDAAPTPTLNGHEPENQAKSTHGPAIDIDSARTDTIVDSSSQALLDELRAKQSSAARWPIALIAVGLVLGMGYLGRWPTWLLVLIAAGGAAATYAVHANDVLRRTVVIFYDFEPQLEAAFARLHEAGSVLARCKGQWHVGSSAKVHDGRYHAGAGQLVSRTSTSIGAGSPPIVNTNVSTLSIGVGKQTLHFFPDKVLIFEGNSVGGVGYQELQVDWGHKRFIEEEAVPGDTQVVDKAWRYPNRDGTPDRRFKDNRQLPVCLYGELTFYSATGLHELIQTSRADVVEDFVVALQNLKMALPSERRQGSQASG